MIDSLYRQVDIFLKPYADLMEQKNICIGQEDIDKISGRLAYDVEAKMQQDPISRSLDFVFCSNTFKAICVYRIANYLYFKTDTPDQAAYQLFAYTISEDMAAKTSIEIHPCAKIGKAFVIDHGMNTLIGATSEIGDHCTILQNVVLGARKITYNSEGKRHPTIGNYVQIAGGVNILGAIVIGDHVFIGPGCTISENIPDYARVKLVKSMLICQIGKPDHLTLC